MHIKVSMIISETGDNYLRVYSFILYYLKEINIDVIIVLSYFHSLNNLKN